MEILREGIKLEDFKDKVPEGHYFKMCKTCSCVFSFEKHEVKEEFDRMDKWKSITCPYCNTPEDVWFRT